MANEVSYATLITDGGRIAKILAAMLHVNLYELLKQNNFRGLSTSLLRLFLGQLLTSLRALRRAGVIHCDIKVRCGAAEHTTAGLTRIRPPSSLRTSSSSPSTPAR